MHFTIVIYNFSFKSKKIKDNSRMQVAVVLYIRGGPGLLLLLLLPKSHI